MPGSGKTALSQRIAERVKMPLIAKDTIKELLFDTLGWSDREWSKKLGAATFELMDYFVQQQLQNGCSLILESNFKPEFDSAKFQKWKDAYGCDITQIVLHADPEILAQRFMERAESGERHPGHADMDNKAEWKKFFADPQNAARPVDVESKIKIVDTSDFSKVDFDEIVEFVSRPTVAQ